MSFDFGVIEYAEWFFLFRIGWVVELEFEGGAVVEFGQFLELFF